MTVPPALLPRRYDSYHPLIAPLVAPRQEKMSSLMTNGLESVNSKPMLWNRRIDDALHAGKDRSTDEDGETP